MTSASAFNEMTIASAFNEIAVANGGQADNSGTIAGAVDALTDALAGSDVAQGATIEDGVRVLGEYISGGGGGTFGGTNYCYNKFGSPVTVSAYASPQANGFVALSAVQSGLATPIAVGAYVGVFNDGSGAAVAYYDDGTGSVGAFIEKTATVEFDGDNIDLYKVPAQTGETYICVARNS